MTYEANQKDLPAFGEAEHRASRGDHDHLAHYIQLGLLLAECRRQLFPTSDFSDAQWHMISHLFVAKHLGGHQSVMTKELIHVSGLPQGSAWRHLKELEQKGAVLSIKPKRDARRTMISLTPSYSALVEKVSAQLRRRLAKAAIS